MTLHRRPAVIFPRRRQPPPKNKSPPLLCDQLPTVPLHHPLGFGRCLILSAGSWHPHLSACIPPNSSVSIFPAGPPSPSSVPTPFPPPGLHHLFLSLPHPCFPGPFNSLADPSPLPMDSRRPQREDLTCSVPFSPSSVAVPRPWRRLRLAGECIDGCSLFCFPITALFWLYVSLALAHSLSLPGPRRCLCCSNAMRLLSGMELYQTCLDPDGGVGGGGEGGSEGGREDRRGSGGGQHREGSWLARKNSNGIKPRQ